MTRPPSTDDLEGEEWEAALDKAEVCLAAGLQPSEYDLLTNLEREAFIEVLTRRNRTS